jgi:predicted transcriptional regulator
VVGTGRRDHVLRGPLENALKGFDHVDVSAVVDVVLRTLDQQKLISFAPAGDLPLLSTHGRALIAILEDPGITLRALAIYLGISESNAQKSVKALLERGLIAKTKVKNSTHYEFVPAEGFYHADITRLFDAILKLVKTAQSEAPDIQPSEVEDPAF